MGDTSSIYSGRAIHKMGHHGGFLNILRVHIFGKLDKYHGPWTLDISNKDIGVYWDSSSIFNEGRPHDQLVEGDIEVKFFYHARRNRFDTKYVGQKGIKKDIWYEISLASQDRIHFHIRRRITAWAVKEKVKTFP